MGRASRDKQNRRQERNATPPRRRPSISFERPDYNSRISFIAVPEFPPTDSRHGKGRPEGSAGVYCVTFVLSIPGRDVFREQMDLGTSHLTGDSLLVLPANAAHVDVQLVSSNATHASMILTKNQHGRLSSVVMRVQAESFVEAERTAYDAVSGFLSYVSYLTDVAVDVVGYETLEESIGTVKGRFGLVGRHKALRVPIESGAVVSDDRYRRVFAAYREGMNATNAFYQALSFAKAIEGCRKIREAKNAEAKAEGKQPFTPPLHVPEALEAVPVPDDLTRVPL